MMARLSLGIGNSVLPTLPLSRHLQFEVKSKEANAAQIPAGRQHR